MSTTQNGWILQQTARFEQSLSRAMADPCCFASTMELEAVNVVRLIHTVVTI